MRATKWGHCSEMLRKIFLHGFSIKWYVGEASPQRHSYFRNYHKKTSDRSLGRATPVASPHKEITWSGQAQNLFLDLHANNAMSGFQIFLSTVLALWTPSCNAAAENFQLILGGGEKCHQQVEHSVHKDVSEMSMKIKESIADVSK